MVNQSRLKFVFKYKLLLIGYIERLISGFFRAWTVSLDVTLVPLLSLPNGPLIVTTVYHYVTYSLFGSECDIRESILHWTSVTLQT